jgi:pterin-4a-carbinolamine dehydratase
VLRPRFDLLWAVPSIRFASLAAAVTDSDEDDLAGEDNWLAAEDGRAFDRRIAKMNDLAVQFLNGLADLPTKEQLESRLSAPAVHHPKINTTFMTVNLQVIIRDKPCIHCCTHTHPM